MATPYINDSGHYTAAPMQDYLQKSFVGHMVRYRPAGATPLFLMLSMMAKSKAISTDHQFFGKTMKFPSVTVTTAAIAADTTVAVANTADIVQGDILMNRATPAGEQVLVTGINSATELAIRRAFGTTVAGALPLNAVLVKVGNAFEQASDRPAPVSIDPLPTTNYTQIFRNSWALSRTVSLMMPIVGDDLISENKVDAGDLHRLDIEKALLFGQAFKGVHNNQVITKMNGLVASTAAYDSNHIVTAQSTTTFTQINEYLERGFNRASNSPSGSERLLACGSNAIRVINEIARKNGNYQLMQGQQEFGLSFRTLITDRGTFKILEHPLLNSNPDWAKMAMSIDLGVLKLAYLAGVETTHTGYGMDGKPVEDGRDAVGGTYLTELTLENLNPAAHVVITNLTAGAAG